MTAKQVRVKVGTKPVGMQALPNMPASVGAHAVQTATMTSQPLAVVLFLLDVLQLVQNIHTECVKSNQRIPCKHALQL